jgi:hypothetical protein
MEGKFIYPFYSWIGLKCWEIFVWCEIILNAAVITEVNARCGPGPDTLSCNPGTDTFPVPSTSRRLKFMHHLDYSFTVSNFLFLNWCRELASNQVLLQQNLKYQFMLGDENAISLSGCFDHDLGLQSYFDSLTKVNLDENTLTARVELSLRHGISCVFTSVLATRLLDGFDYSVDDSGTLVRLLNSSFLTPLTGTFSLGMGFRVKNTGTLNVGISSAKLTYIRDSGIFRIRKTEEFFGVSRGKCCRLEYGLSLQFLADRDLFRRVHWNCDLLFFKNYHAPVDVAFRNLVGIRINSFLKASIQTRVFYEEKISKNLQLENMVSIGFYFHL